MISFYEAVLVDADYINRQSQPLDNKILLLPARGILVCDHQQ